MEILQMMSKAEVGNVEDFFVKKSPDVYNKNIEMMLKKWYKKI